MTRFAVLAARCDQCLYGPNKIVSNERRADILRTLERRDTFFVCHKATIAGVEAVCRGDWDQRGGGQMGRIAGRLGMLVFVAEADLHTLPPAPVQATHVEDEDDDFWDNDPADFDDQEDEDDLDEPDVPPSEEDEEEDHDADDMFERAAGPPDEEEDG